MLRITAARSAAGRRLHVSSVPRFLHSSATQLNVTNKPPTSVPGTPPTPNVIVESPTPVTPATPNLSASSSASPSSSASSSSSSSSSSTPKKKHRARNLIFSLTLLGALFYSGGIWYSLRNDNFHDFFTEYVPGGEQIVLYIEEREFQRRFPNAGKKALEDTSPRVTVRRGGATWKIITDQEYKGPASGPYVSAVAKKDDKVVKETTTAPAPQLAKQSEEVKPVEEKPAEKKPTVEVPKEPLVVKEVVLPKLPKFVFDGKIDPSLEGVVESINQLFTVIRQSGNAGPAELKALADSLGEVSKRFVIVKDKSEADLKNLIEQQTLLFADQATKAASEHAKEVEAIEEKWKEGFFTERQRILNTFKKRLQVELNNVSRLYDSKINNEIVAASIEKDKEYSTKIFDLVENERNSRLSKLNEVKLALEEVVGLSDKVEKSLELADNTAKLQLAIGSLTNALLSPYPVPLGPIIGKIKQAGGSDPLIAAAVASVPVSAYGGVLSPAQLAARLRLLAPEIRKVSLVPDNAGVAGFFGSWILSKLLWKKEGRPVGNDVESILARAQSALGEGRVVEAVREINSLDGWSKKLADDWLTEGRKRSEIEFLAQVLGEEGKVLQFKF
ncbi:mitochondrial inner membrane protein Mitofilin [Lipomyces japonicus]|uniref:mitochondrial inner membrane protein Mitofilin n=1 Tax=Lipomyces japonicus TaxID=56871 RepID=UPI0034CD6B43